MDDQVKTVNNVVYTFQLNQVSHDKASYMGHIKEYMKAIKAHLEKSNPARAQVFQEKAKTHVANIVKNIANYEFFVGSSMDPNGLVALLNYREDGITPYFTLFKDGLKMEKVVCVSCLRLISIWVSNVNILVMNTSAPLLEISYTYRIPYKLTVSLSKSTGLLFQFYVHSCVVQLGHSVGLSALFLSAVF